jgi:hypothetical protein
MSHLKSVPKTHAFVMPRHRRYLFLIDSKEPSELIMKLIRDNYKLWGGRFNPFVPVYEQEIPEGYQPVIKHCDPDFIYYSPGVDINAVKQQLTHCHPKEYLPLREDGMNNFSGVFSGYMLAEENHSIYYFFRNRSFMHTTPSVDKSVPNVYKLSFGFQPRYIDQGMAITGYKSLEINNDNIRDINRIMCEELPSLTSMLCELKSDPRLFDPENDWDANKFELIIYNPENAFEDLLYFWNRRLFQYKGQRRLNQLIATAQEIRELIMDDHFEVSLTTMMSAEVYVVSGSCPPEELDELVAEIRPHFTRLRISTHVKSEFPYPVIRPVTTDYSVKYTVKQVLNDVKDYLQFPSPFSSNYLPADSSYMMDVSLVLQKDHQENELKLPFKTSTTFITRTPGRIDKNNRISLVIDRHEPGSDFYIPSGPELISMRLSYLVQDETSQRISIGGSQPSPAGLKLTSFVNLFSENWHEIDYYMSDPFWHNLIKQVTYFGKTDSISLLSPEMKEENQDVAKSSAEHYSIHVPVKDKSHYEKLNKSNIAELKGIFCNKDLSNELTRYYFRHREALRKKLSRHVETTDPQVLRDIIYNSVRADMLNPINSSLQYFLSVGILFLGMRVKCKHCGSHEWYTLKMLDNRMECKGCLNIISPSVTSELYYKFNDVIVNNVKSFSKPNGEESEGNYIVLRTLAYFHERDSSRIRSFIYGPCLDITIEYMGKLVATDIDLIFIQDGKLTIGEAKVLTTDFNKKVINNMIQIANLVRPDRIMLAYQKGPDIESKLKQIKAALENPDCEVVSFKIPGLFHKTGRIFGVKDE